jgi:hypothetical protein
VPLESTFRRLLSKVDADRFDTAISGFVQRLCTGVAPVGRRRVLAVDGKTVRVRHEVACSEWITLWRRRW